MVSASRPSFTTRSGGYFRRSSVGTRSRALESGSRSCARSSKPRVGARGSSRIRDPVRRFDSRGPLIRAETVVTSMDDRQLSILVVDDDDVDVMTVKRVFAKANVKNPLIIARDGVEALAT